MVLTRARMIRVAAITAAVALLFLALRPGAEQVSTGTATRGALETTIDAEAVTRVRDRFVVTAPTAGQLQRILLEPGDTVVAGAVVARITPLPLDPQTVAQMQARVASAVAAAQEAETRLEQARQALAQTERSTERIRVVAREGSVSREALERAELELELARRNHDAAAARLRAMGAEVSAARAALMGLDVRGGRGVSAVRAPAGGRVLQVPERSERVVAAGTPLVVIGDPARIEVVIDVLSTDAVAVLPGQPLRLHDWGGAQALDGTVRRVEPAGFTKVSALGVEEQRVNVIADLAAPQPGLGDGFRAQAQIVTWSGTDVLKVPASALFRTQDGWQVFVVEDGRARPRAVTVGRRGAAEVELLSGLSAGMAVILFPTERIAAGTRVRTRR